ncbi:MAG: hypothetical protein KIT13_09635 [Burkholderiales bacterium]|nr:hypothetical protein [Burkholderiales bacterium]MCW5604532.1 hypothetical protein [Burkholderiales bacterium]
MSGLLAAAADLQTFLQKARQRFCFIGGLALQRWGEPRFTRDVDLSLLCPYGNEDTMAGLLLDGFRPRIPDARAFAIEHRVLLLESRNGVPLDIALAAIPFEERCIGRASGFDFGGMLLLTCGAEDLIVMKAFAGRDRDWADIESVVIRQSPQLDWNLILAEITPLSELRDADSILPRLKRLRG